MVGIIDATLSVLRVCNTRAVDDFCCVVRMEEELWLWKFLAV